MSIFRKIVIPEACTVWYMPEDGAGVAVGFYLSEPHGGKELTDSAIGELAFLGFALIESVGNDFDRKDTVFHLIFKPQDGALNLGFETVGVGI